MYTVTFIDRNTGNFEVSRYFNSIRAARKWAKWLGEQKFVKSVNIYRGQAGGELLESTAA